MIPGTEKNNLADSFERLAISPKDHDMMLTDINKTGLAELGEAAGIENLSPSSFPNVPFPIEGMLYGENNRLMVCLPCRRVKKSESIINVWFILDTGSNCTFLARETIEALIGKTDPIPRAIFVSIQDSESNVECHLSPPNSHFPDANVLGMVALRQLEVSINIDWKRNTFKLIKL